MNHNDFFLIQNKDIQALYGIWKEMIYIMLIRVYHIVAGYIGSNIQLYIFNISKAALEP